MLAIYLFCAGLGIPLVALFAFSGSEGDAELGGGVDVDAGFDMDVDAGGFDGDVGHGVGDFTGLVRRIPVSSYAMFLAFFGGAGAVGTWAGVGFAQTLLLAVSLGLIGAFVNAAAFGFLRANAADSSMSDREIEGRVATVSIPIEAGKRGRVWLDTGEERLQLTAGAVESIEDLAFERGEKVVIVEMQNGVAQVMGIDPDLAD